MSTKNSNSEQFLKLENEKRRRIHTTAIFNSKLLTSSYFDFFSKDAFVLILESIGAAKFFLKNEVTSDLVLLAFINLAEKDDRFLNLFEKYELETDILVESILESAQIFSDSHINCIKEKKISLKEIFNVFMDFTFGKEMTDQYKNLFFYCWEEVKSVLPKKLFTNFPLFHFEKNEHLNIKFSLELQNLFLKATENAVQRFKTPIISPEILLLTFLEERTKKAGKILRYHLKTESRWYQFRYDLLKTLHSEQIFLVESVDKKYLLYLYLLQSRLTRKEFHEIRKTYSMSEITSLNEITFRYRNKIISHLVKSNFYDDLKKEIFISIHAINQRKYTKKSL